MLLLITTNRRRDVLRKTLKGGRAPDREWHIGALQFLQQAALQFFYTSHGIVHWFPQQAADKTKLQTAADDDSAKEKGHEDGDAADEKKNGKQRVPLPSPLKRRTADGSQKGKHSSTFVAADVISGGEGGVCSNFGGRPPGGEGASGGAGRYASRSLARESGCRSRCILSISQ